jgi:hypothetical protein
MSTRPTPIWWEDTLDDDRQFRNRAEAFAASEQEMPLVGFHE